MSVKNIAKYIGKPYETYHCFDLVKEFYLDLFQLDLKHFYEGETVPSRTEVQSLIVTNKGEFEKVEEPQFGDIIVVNLYGYSCHIAVYLYENLMLHTIRGVGSCIEPIKKYEKMIEGYYRHKEPKK